MTPHIDLGDELADWSEPTSDPRQKPDQPVHTPTPDGGSYVPLRDLQAAGFNTTPPPGFGYKDGPGWRALGTLTNPDSITVKTFGDDGIVAIHYTVDSGGSDD